MKLTECKKCATPVARFIEAGLTYRTDLTALNLPDLARAWLAGHTVYKIHTLTTTQWVSRQWPSPVSIAGLIQQLKTGRPPAHTYLLAHQCPGALTCIDQSLATWQPHDAAVFHPAPQPAPTNEGIPF
jgi:hypothetical protein